MNYVSARIGRLLSFRRALLAVVAAAALFQMASAGLNAPTANDRFITKAVTVYLGREHLSQHPLDDEISQRCLHTFLKTLDAMKVYFTQADIDSFNQQRNELDNMARKGDVSFAYQVFKVFLQRIDERVKLVDELLAQDQDFTVDEEMISDPDAATYAKNDEEVRENWRKRIKYDLLMQKVENRVGKEAKEKLSRRYHSFAKRMQQTSADELLEMYLTSLTTAYDPHTSYMSPDTVKNFEILMALNLEGIGASLMADDGYTVVKQIVRGGAAEKDGRLKLEDRVIGVGQGETGEIVDVIDMKLNDVVKMIRGKRGTIVRLKVLSVGDTEPKVYNITREKIELKDSEAQGKVFEQGKKSDGEPLRIGVIDLPSFYMDMEGARLRRPDFKSTTRDTKKILDNFRAENVDAVVVDLRRNGGGSLTEAINFTGLFIDEGPVVQVKGPDGKVQQYDDTEPGAAWEGPLVVLTSRFSASASEIFAGAIQDYQRGLIVGDNSTHGKGTVQTVVDLGQTLFKGETLGALKLTIQQFYRPNGASTQNRGVLADVELPSLTSHLDVGESDLDYALPFQQVDSAQFQKLHQVDQVVLAQLRKLSAQRWGKSEEFAKVNKDIDRYEQQKGRKTVTLNEAKFMEERAERDAQKKEEEKLDDLVNGSAEGIKRDYYVDEALAITQDYLQLIHVAQAN